MGIVLVADDNPLSLDFFSAAIGSAGHAVETASDGIAAVARAASTQFDLMLIDNRMPGLDGPHALQAIRSGCGPSRLATALATTADGGLSADALLEAGFDGVLVKPVGLHELRGLLVRYLGAGASGQGALLDDALALEKTGGDTRIVAALRELLVGELDALPEELRAMRHDTEPATVRDRLHRLDASAGFCGAPALALAIAELRADLDRALGWPEESIDRFLQICARTRSVLR